MKKLFTLSTLVIALTTSGLAAAGFNDGKTVASGGFSGPTQGVILTAKEALDAVDDTPVKLTGYIVSSLGKKDYLFKDQSGQVVVEISQKRWQGQSVSPSDKVEILGEVDKDWNSVEIEVESIRKL